ncbi:membrane protein [Oceanicola sp. 22II-s10i]|uniref:OmpA family protein n=1 Tax=Oceanicola sp. 22II-s10i TaxID=1317116 RepID=UPI000B51F5FF|nr:OmpA family protein [Oceanicola sp. 22II-s10i]OWU86421.1 membrane protein [Oceanicola sp. 22II-s10i]
MNFRGHIKGLLAATSVLAIAACTGDGYSPWTKEAGSIVDGGDFGDATMNNTLIQNGDRTYVVNLNERFTKEVPPTVNFAFNSATIDAEAAAILRRQADWIRQFPEVRFRVYGHTDLVGSNSYNYGLGLRRANAVVSYLTRFGISRSRLEAVVSRGETQPLIVTQGRERQNRRTVTEVIGFVDGDPLVLDGKYAQIVYREYVQSALPQTGLTGVDGQSAVTTPN